MAENTWFVAANRERNSDLLNASSKATSKFHEELGPKPGEDNSNGKLAVVAGVALAGAAVFATKGRAAATFLAESESNFGRNMLKMGDKLGWRNYTYRLAEISETALERQQNYFDKGSVAAGLFEKAAARNQGDAQFRLSRLNNFGEKEKSVWLEKAAANGSPSAQIQYGSALWRNGQHKEGLALIENVAKNKGEAGAQDLLGGYYARGAEGFTPDMVKAKHWFSKAAENGSGHGHLMMAKIIKGETYHGLNLENPAGWAEALAKRAD